jgi:hypothetical protein
LVIAGQLSPVTDSDPKTAGMSWDGTAWHDLGLNGIGTSAGAYGGKLVLGGDFPSYPEADSIGHVAILDGTSWKSLGPGLNNRVYSLGNYRGQLVAAGFFTASGNDSIQGIASWNGSKWSALGLGIPGPGTYYFFYGYYPPVASLIESNDKLYVGGTFRLAGTDTIWGAAVWDGTHWSPMDASVRAWITDMKELNGKFYAVGSFYKPSTNIAWSVGIWENGEWKPLGDPSTRFDLLESIGLHEGSVYVGQSTGDVGAANCFAGNLFRLTGSSWAPFVCTDGFRIGEIQSWQGRLVIASGFDEVDGLVVRGIASFGPEGWTAFGQGLEFVENVWGDRGPMRVDALAATSMGIVAGGQFTFAGGLPARNIAIWTGERWTAGGAGLLGSVHAVVESGGRVFAGGDFGATGEGYISELDGDTWVSIGNSLSGPVRALLARGNSVIAGGAFAWAGGHEVNGVAEWDGAKWLPLGNGFDDEVLAIAEYQGKLIAVGRFENSAGQVVHHVAAFDGHVWARLGDGVNGTLLTAVAWGNLLVVGGEFTTVDGWPATNVATWDGSHWLPLGDGIDGPVRSLAVSNGVLVAGGSFVHAGSEEANHLAYFDGNSWRPIGEGVNGDVYSIAALPDSGIAVGGVFDRSGKTASRGIAFWKHPLTDTSGQQSNEALQFLSSPNPFFAKTTLTVRVQSPERVSVFIMDLQGRVVARPWDGIFQPGQHSITWDGLTEAHQPAPAGVYFAHALGETIRISRKLVKLSR